MDDPKVREFVAKVHESVIHYGRSTGFCADKMREGGPQYADAAVVYKSDVIQGNRYIRDKGLKFPRLAAIHPKEGTFATNHPFALVNRHYAVLRQVDPRQLTGPFQLQPPGPVLHPQRTTGSVDATDHQAALATSAGAVKKHTAEINRAIDYGVELECHFKQAADTP